MKKNLSTLIIVVIAICLVSYTFDLNHTSSIVQAASESSLEVSSARPADKEPLSLTQSSQLAVFVVVVLVCALFGILAVSPLLIDNAIQPKN